MAEIIVYGVTIAVTLFCVWNGLKISIGDKVSMEWYPVKRLFKRGDK